MVTAFLYKCPPTHICSTCRGQCKYSLHTAFHSNTVCTKTGLMGNCVSFQPAKRLQECRLINMHTHEHRPVCIHTLPSQTDVSQTSTCTRTYLCMFLKQTCRAQAFDGLPSMIHTALNPFDLAIRLLRSTESSDISQCDEARLG